MMTRLTTILKEIIDPVDFNTFLNWITLSFPQVGYNQNGEPIVNILLRTKNGAPFKYQYKHNNAVLIDYATYDTKKGKLSYQVKKTIYDKFYKKGK